MKNRNSVVQFLLAFFILCSVSNFSFAQAAADSSVKPLYSSVYDGNPNITFTQGSIIKLKSGQYYEILDKSNIKNMTANPTVNVYKDGKKLNLVIQNISTPIKAFLIKDVLESTIDGDFKGWDGNTSWKLVNGDTWQQEFENGNIYANLFRPAVTIMRVSDGTYKMMVKGIKEITTVKRK